MIKVKAQANEVRNGQIFRYGGLGWCRLDKAKDGVLFCAETPLYIRQFGYTNDWYRSAIRKTLKRDLLNAIIKYGGKREDFMVFESDLISADGIDEYGVVDDVLALLSDDMYKNYRGVLKPTHRPFWTLTPHSAGRSSNTMCHYVTARGDIDKIYCNWMGVYVRPVCVLSDAAAGLKIELDG